MNRVITTGVGALLVATVLTPPAGADFDNRGRFEVATPCLLCDVGLGGERVDCSGDFPQAPIAGPGLGRYNLAVITADGTFSYGYGNIGVGDEPVLNILQPGQSVDVRGWNVSAGPAGVTLTDNSTGHGMTINADRTVRSF